MDDKIVEWLLHLFNVSIFTYIFYNAIGTSCFGTVELSLGLLGLGSSITHFAHKLLKGGLKNEKN